MAGAGVRDILLDGPWRHRDIAANGIRFHVALGEQFSPRRPLVVLLHGFGEFWWAWRHQIPALDAAGFSAAAMDLRGYGASDKTPSGYDPQTTAFDVTGVGVRDGSSPRLGERRCHASAGVPMACEPSHVGVLPTAFAPRAAHHGRRWALHRGPSPELGSRRSWIPHHRRRSALP